MPRLKQPTRLQDMAMDFLVGFLANYCDELSSQEAMGKLRRVVAAMKEEICCHIPGHLAVDFYKKFFNEYESLHELKVDLRSDAIQRVVLELVMDREITGLRCEGAIMAFLDPRDSHRFKGLRLLDLCFFCYPLPISLEDFRLCDLTTFVFVENCTDSNLKVIGRNCPKLVFLDVRDSIAVTNRGLRRLNSCLELRFVFVNFCRVSHTGVKQFLSVNTKVEEFSAWSNSGKEGFDCFSNPDLSVYPSIKSFTIVLDRVSNQHLRSVVEKFPNLTQIGISGYLAGDLCMLKSLGKLSRLDFNGTSGFSWDNLRTLLVSVGGNITDLRTCCSSKSTSCITQNDLNFLFRFCGGIEHLEFDYRALFDGEKLAIPSFERLKELVCHIPRAFRRRKAELEFGELLELEKLTIDRFHITARTIKSMILHNPNFPKLKLLHISEISGRCDGTDAITQVAKKNNLDFEIIGI